MPSPEQTEKIKNRIDLISDPLYVVKQGTRGERHGPEDRQYNHWNAQDATTIFQKRGFTTIAKRWKDDPSYRETQREHGRTPEYCIFVDYLKKVEIEYKATWDKRNRNKNQIVLRWKDEKNPGKMSVQDDLKKAARSLATVSHQEGMGQVADSDRGRSTSINVRNSDGNVKIGDKFIDRRRHLHPRHPNNGNTTGKNDKIGTDGRNGTNEWRLPERPSHFAHFFSSKSIVFFC